jgi:RHS repeat-associated protein
VSEYAYDVYGKATLSGSETGNMRLFTGREYDQEIGLYYNRARYYDSNLGRFISRDPIGVADNVDLYSYTANNPVNSVDRMGLSGKALWGRFGEETFNNYFWIETANAPSPETINQHEEQHPIVNRSAWVLGNVSITGLAKVVEKGIIYSVEK